jgi:pimeloyl-ACP methyl ester carboxylesterase
MAGSRKITLSVDVTGTAPEGCDQVEVDLFLPAVPAPAPVFWCCVPGGGVTRSYFDLEVPPEAGQYSMARFIADRGMPVLIIDPPGVGGSDVPTDPYTLTPPAVAAVLDVVVTDVAARMAGGLFDGAAAIEPRMTVGVGHSAGGLLVACQQARHRSFDVVALLGFSDTGMIQVLTDQEKSFIGRPEDLLVALPDLVKARFGEPLPNRPYADLDNPLSTGPRGPVQEAEARAATNLLALVGLMAIIPGSMQPEMDQIDVATFAAVGDRDIAGDIGLLVGQLPQCNDLTLITLPGVGHNHNMSASRLTLWSRLVHWADSVGFDQA